MASNLNRNHRCPCGDDQCYLESESFEKEGETLTANPTTLLHDPNFTPKISPNLDKNKKITVLPPHIGQTFQSDDEALEYYTNFARKNGFLVRKERSKGNPNHPMGVYKREFVCHRAGPALPVRQGELKHQRRKKPSRCRCEAQMVIKKNISGVSAKWLVVNFSNNHNHELLDFSNVNNCAPCHRYISQPDRDRILALAKGGCEIALIMRALEMEKGIKPGQLTFTEKDLKTFLQNSMSVNPEYEGVELIKSCKAMRAKNPDFRFEFSTRENNNDNNNNNNNKLEHIAWSYVGSIQAYKAFGDVVIFDTGHQLCTYGRPVVAWFGIDNNGNIVFFCCAILLDDKPESYRWALKAFLRIMDGKHPQSILTEFNLGLKDIISTELPTTKHAISFWHVISKLPNWFAQSLGSQFDKFKSKFCQINEFEGIEGFEQEWDQIVLEFGLARDRHIELLFINRFFWAFPYIKGWFFGGLLDNNKINNNNNYLLLVNSFFKGFLNSQTRLKDFVEQVGVAVDFQNQSEEESTTQQNQQNQQNPKIKTCLPLEEHALTILTHYAFKIFQREITESTQFAVYETSRETYLVRHHLKAETEGNIVNCVPSNESINCTCKGFETYGILCRHVLRVLSLKNCFLLPEKYILPRWRKDSSLFAKCNGIKYRSRALKSLASIMIQESAITKERFEYVQWNLGRLLEQVREMGAPPDADVAAPDWSEGPGSCFDVDTGLVTVRPAARGRPRKSKGNVKLKSINEV